MTDEPVTTGWLGRFPMPWLGAAGALVGMILCLAAPQVHAIPSYARQTGASCASCHVGAYGPQLTPFGMRFKISGYADSDGQGTKIPLSAMLLGSWTRTDKDQSSKASKHEGRNDNAALNEASAFLAGRLMDHAGTFTQVTYSDIERQTALDTTDTRYALPLTIGGKDAILGIAVNNDPGVTDPFNRPWRPLPSSELSPGMAAAPMLFGALGQQVGGASIYGFVDDSWYAEAGGYHSLSHDTLHALGEGDDLGRTHGLIGNWRLGYLRDWHKQNVEAGLFGLDMAVEPHRLGGPTDKYRDLGAELAYQFLGTRRHIVTASSSFIHEHQMLDGSQELGEVGNRAKFIDAFNLNASYFFQQTYGLEAGYFNRSGSHDAMLHAPQTDSGSRLGSPNSAGYIIQADWTPWGKDDSWLSPWTNLRLGIQYLMYSKFNGARHDYDGFGRRADDNNTLYLFAWTSF